jgi:hypothetical protein
MKTAGLSVDQAPPLPVPVSFYALMPLALLTAGILLALDGNALLASHWSPQTIAWTHLTTLGFLVAAMLGSLYQMVPVVLGTPVPAIRLAYAVAAALGSGVAALVGGLMAGVQTLILVGGALLACAFTAFLVPMAIALVRARAGGPTRMGMRGALLCLLALALVGLRLAWGHATGALPEHRQVWLVTHVALGLVGWVGGLTMAVSWQVVPMFYLTQPFPQRVARGLALLVPASVLVATALALAGAELTPVLLAATPAAIVIWLVQPILLAKLIQQRRRRRSDPSLQFWLLGLACAPLCLLLAVLTWTTDWQVAPLLFGWLAIFGWAGAIVHGMLTRILPFLTWFHRIAQVHDMTLVPPMKQLLPDWQARWNLRAHGATLLLGALAIVSRLDVLARLTGGLLAVTGVLVAAALVGTLVRGRRTRDRSSEP